jgi:hypothetical protein
MADVRDIESGKVQATRHLIGAIEGVGEHGRRGQPDRSAERPTDVAGMAKAKREILTHLATSDAIGVLASRRRRAPCR